MSKEKRERAFERWFKRGERWGWQDGLGDPKWYMRQAYLAGIRAAKRSKHEQDPL